MSRNALQIQHSILLLRPPPFTSTHTHTPLVGVNNHLRLDTPVRWGDSETLDLLVLNGSNDEAELDVIPVVLVKISTCPEFAARCCE